MKLKIVLFLLCIISANCKFRVDREEHDENYEKAILSWKDTRIERLKSKTGWLNIVGLYWLKEGLNSTGSNPENHIIFPENAPEYCGTIKLSNDTVFYIPGPDSNIRINSIPAKEMFLENDLTGNPTVLESGRYAWFIIRRGDQYGIRLRDYENAALNELTFIPSYPVSQKWKITARFIPFDSIRNIEVATVTGGKEFYKCPGKLSFKVNGKKYELLPFIEGERFFIIFGDRTNGKETYGAGRFLYTEIPDKENRITLDFNMAYNPPCAFTPFATCPMPPAENLLDVNIEAGEKEVHIEGSHSKL